MTGDLFPDLYNPAPDPLWTPVARTTDPETSHLAAKAAQAHFTADEATALRIHAQHSAGLTDFELADLAHIPQTSIGVRRKALQRRGYVEDSGVKRPSPTRSPAIVWRITARGLQAAQQREVA